MLTTVILLALSLGLALLVQESTRWKGLLRTSFLVPSALGLASASLLFYVLYSPIAGPFADLMAAWGFTFLGTPDGALWSTIFLIVWRYAGFYMLLMLVGLQGIPDDVYEAARIDGASRWQTFRSVTHPAAASRRSRSRRCCASPGSLLAFEQFYILTKGGPDNSTITIVQLIYSVAFQGQNDLGVAGRPLGDRAARARRDQHRADPRIRQEGGGLMSVDHHAPAIGRSAPDRTAPSRSSLRRTGARTGAARPRSRASPCARPTGW